MPPRRASASPARRSPAVAHGGAPSPADGTSGRIQELEDKVRSLEDTDSLKRKVSTLEEKTSALVAIIIIIFTIMMLDAAAPALETFRPLLGFVSTFLTVGTLYVSLAWRVLKTAFLSVGLLLEPIVGPQVAVAMLMVQWTAYLFIFLEMAWTYAHTRRFFDTYIGRALCAILRQLQRLVFGGGENNPDDE